MSSYWADVSDPQLWTLVWWLVVAHTGTSVLCFALYTIFDMFPSVFQRFKLQPLRTSNSLALLISDRARSTFFDSGAEGSLFTQAAVGFAVSHCVVLPLFVTAMFPLVVPDRVRSLDLSLPPTPRLLFDLAVCILCEDALFYWTHRLLHHPMLYQHFHKRHHAFNAPITIAAEFAHPVETILGNAIPFFTGPIITNTTGGTLCLWMAIRMLKTCEAHGGYHFPWLPFSFSETVFVGAKRHDFHHSQNTGNFGSFFNFWDWFCGTDTFTEFSSRQSKKAY